LTQKQERKARLTETAQSGASYVVFFAKLSEENKIGGI